MKFKCIRDAFFACLVGLALLFSFGVIQIKYQLETPLSKQLEKAQSFIIFPGETSHQIICRLLTLNLIPQSTSPPITSLTILGHKAFLKSKGWDRTFQSGEYWIHPDDNIRKIYNKFQTGSDQVHYPLTIPEGLTTQQIYNLLKEAPFLEGPLPQTILITPTLFYWPETYNFTRGTLRKDVLSLIQQEGAVKLQQIWDMRSHDCPLQSPHELLILGSIVEKETAIEKERRLIAQAFLNRLKKGMPLQADPTVSYGLYIRDQRPVDRPLTRSELRDFTPYNTYMISSLPPGPICHPGLASLKAITHPEEGNFLYFVANGEGRHTFSTSYKDHVKHHKTWRKILAQRQKKS